MDATDVRLVDALRERVPSLDLLIDADVPPRRLHDWAAEATGRPLALARVRSVDEVSAVLRICGELGVPVVPQGGLTGLSGGAVPIDGCLALSLELFSGIEELDIGSATITVRAGTPLQVVQQAADAAGMHFPLDLGARGSCQIGGNVSTNAGGNRVIRYGMMRDLVLGMEAVLPDGTVLSSLGKMLKNNTGPDWKHLFIGSEGIFGVVTRVVLRLYPKPLGTATALCAIEGGYDAVLALLGKARRDVGPTLSAFEAMWPDFYRLVTTEFCGRNAPLPIGAPFYVLVESDGSDAAIERARMESFLSSALDGGIVSDVVVAESESQRLRLWAVRDGSGEIRPHWGPHSVFDVSAAVSELGTLAGKIGMRLRARWPDVRTAIWGHVGDGNIHVCAKAGDGIAFEREIEEIVYGATREHGGSISAEHGIGLLKREWLGHSRSPSELALIRTLRGALDPQGIMNPTKVLL
jgi:FAD/FMN-containing dehydrogenase